MVSSLSQIGNVFIVFLKCSDFRLFCVLLLSSHLVVMNLLVKKSSSLAIIQ